MKCAHFQNAAFEMGGVFLFFAHARAREGLKKNLGRAGALPGAAFDPASSARLAFFSYFCKRVHSLSKK